MSRPDAAVRADTSTTTAFTEPIDAPGNLLDHLGTDGFAWFEGSTGFVTNGIAATVAPDDAVEYLRALDHTADPDAPPGAGPRAVGALPFRGTGRMLVPACIVGCDSDGRAWRTRVGTATPALARPAASPPTRFTVAPLLSRSEWDAMVTHVLDAITSGRLDKAVLARAVEVTADAPFDLRSVLAHLRATQPGCVVFADGGFVGASPELLVAKSGRDVVARPLAGTGIDPDALMASAKDAHEHRVVVDAVVAALTRSCDDVIATGPAPATFATVTHLATTVSGRVRAAELDIVDLVAALHPTPAVGGHPRPAALDEIAALEPVDRGRYAGPCGWVNADGDGTFVVGLRSGQIDGTRAVLHAGAGIVAGSEPASEWAETAQKLTPMLQTLVRP